MASLRRSVASVCLAAVAAQNYAPLSTFFSYTYNDNAVVATTASANGLGPTWKYVMPDLYVLDNATQQPGSVPLNFYFNPTTNHHMTTASAQGNSWARANGYTFVRVEGWVYGNADPSYLPLEMWYSAARGDHFLVGTTDNRNNAIGAGYVLQYVDSWVSKEWIVWPNQPPPGCPFPPSTDLLDYEYTPAPAVPPGIGADTWYPTWTDIPGPNGSTVHFSSWTDGQVNGVSSSSSGATTATTGMAHIIGDDPYHLVITNASVFTEGAAPYQGRYPSFNLYHDGVWYYGTYSLENYEQGVNPPPDCGNWCVLGPFTDIRYSTDQGATWTAPRRVMTSPTDNLFGEAAVNNSKVVVGAPHAVDFGKNMHYSPDGSAYAIATGAVGPQSYESWMQGDTVHLMRTIGAPAPATINEASSWQFYAGGSGANATWSAPGDVSAAQPLFTWVNRTGVVTATYHPELGKYIIVVGCPTVSPLTVAHFDVYMLEAESLTGPYFLISYLPSFGPQAYFVHFPSHWQGNITTGSPATRVAKPGVGHVACSRQSKDAERSLPSLTAADCAAAVSQPLPPRSGSESAAPSFYELFLSYSANFAGGYLPNPAGSGYHWTLLPSRLKLSSAFAARLAARRAALAAASASASVAGGA